MTDTDQRARQAEKVTDALRRHPRTVYQDMIGSDTELTQLRCSLPYLVPFPENDYHDVIPVLDWDHRLPSQAAVLHLYAYYSEKAYKAGEVAYATRAREIEERDKFPEFDVPDFANLPADEFYESVVDWDGKVTQVQLLSEWRRNIDPKDAFTSLQAVRGSEEFKKISLSVKRPDYLGDLEARSWTPPCEGPLDVWTVDVWYLMEYNGVVGKGLSFLVDVNEQEVGTVREFMIRTQ